MAPAMRDDDARAVIERLTAALKGPEQAAWGIQTLAIAPVIPAAKAGRVSRGQVAMALNAALFLDLLERVPTAARYVNRMREAGESIVFDHGALRTIDGNTGTLPSGHFAFGRFLEPLGYEVRGLYPLPALTMTGRAYVQADFPAGIPQFFVSELHVDQLPDPAQGAADAIFAQSVDPLETAEWAALDAIARDRECSMEDAVTILRGALRAFDRQHPTPALADYETLLQHSKEGAWIATEGNAFNHATTRVADVEAHAETLKAEGYPLKSSVEISRNGRVRQTAVLADSVPRRFRLPDGSETTRDVPGSFYEFISRDVDPDTGLLDLTFDSGNATGIFAVTRHQA